MKQTENQKVNFLTRFKWSIFNPENYDVLAFENSKKSFGYFIKLLLLFSFVIAIALTIKLTISYDETMNNIESSIEAVSAENVQINFDQIAEIKELPKAEVCIAFGLASILYIFIIYVFSTIIEVFMLSLLGWLTSRISKIMLKYSQVINIAIYALTLPIILNAIYIIVNIFTKFEIKYFQIMYNAISYIYVVTAILMIKSEMIKQEQELIKIAEEQKKIKEEMEKQKEEKQEEEDSPEKRENKKEEKKEKQRKEKNNGETPEGSSAIV